MQDRVSASNTNAQESQALKSQSAIRSISALNPQRRSRSRIKKLHAQVNSQFSARTKATAKINATKEEFAWEERYRSWLICLKCHCKKGFAGPWCNHACNTYRRNEECVDKCPSDTFPEEHTMNCLGCSFVIANCIIMIQGCKKCSSIEQCDECYSNFHLVNKFCELVSLKFENKELILNLFGIFLLATITTFWITKFGSQIVLKIDHLKDSE
jgi:hypothetical protein